MNFLDKILGRNKSKEQRVEQPETDIADNATHVKFALDMGETHPIQTPPTGTSRLNLSKEIGLNLNKLNLDKPEVLEKRLFLLDISGSMGDKVKDGRKIDHLRDVMKNYEAGKKICFSSDVKRINKADEILYPSGGTDLAYALHFIRKEQRPLPERIVLVSDGEPNDKRDALYEAKELGLPIDIIFIGKEQKDGKKSDGELFMEELAKQTNGQHFVV